MLTESEAWLWIAEQLAISNKKHHITIFHLIDEITSMTLYMKMRDRYFRHIEMRKTPVSWNTNNSAIIFAILMSLESTEL